eukprot:g8234.t1
MAPPLDRAQSTGGHAVKFVPMWHKLGNAPCGPRLRVISWNVLADGANAALSSKHDYCPLEIRIWKDHTQPHTFSTYGRFARTVQRIFELSPDVLCLQECDRRFFDDFADPETGLGEEYVGFHCGDHLPPDLRWPVSRPGNLDNAMFVRRALLVCSSEGAVVQQAEVSLSQQNGNGHPAPRLLHKTTSSSSASSSPQPPFLQIASVQATLFRERLGIEQRLEQEEKENKNQKGGKKGAAIVPAAGARPGVASNLNSGPFTSTVSVSGKTKKRVQTLEESAMWITFDVVVPGADDEGERDGRPPTSIPQSQLVVANTHLFWDPRYPQVKAWQADTFVKMVTSPTSQLCGGGQEGRNPKLDVNYVLCGDFNTIPNFQPEFLGSPAEELGRVKDHFVELLREAATSGDPAVLAARVAKMQAFFSQHLYSGAFQLLSTGKLPSVHPEHPDSFGKTGSTPAGQAGDMVIPTLTNCYSGKFFPKYTTKVDVFEGCLDYIWLAHQERGQGQGPRPAEQASVEMSNEYGTGNTTTSNWTLRREALLDVPCGGGELMPNEKHSSDHFPVGVIIRLVRGQGKTR